MEESKKNSKTELSAHQRENNSTRPNANKKLLIIIGVAILLIAAVWIWKSVQMGNVEKKAENDRQTLKEEARKQIVQAHEAHLKLLAKAYVWAVRADMMQGNINQVNLFASDMVKEKNFQRIVIANDKGIIISSTNKKDEGQPFATVGKAAGLSSDNTTVENVSDSILIMTSPIMGFNNRLGTLLIKYAVQPPAFSK